MIVAKVCLWYSNEFLTHMPGTSKVQPFYSICLWALQGLGSALHDASDGRFSVPGLNNMPSFCI